MVGWEPGWWRMARTTDPSPSEIAAIAARALGIAEAVRGEVRAAPGLTT